MVIEFINPVMFFAIFSLIFRLHHLNRQIVNSHWKCKDGDLGTVATDFLTVYRFINK